MTPYRTPPSPQPFEVELRVWVGTLEPFTLKGTYWAHSERAARELARKFAEDQGFAIEEDADGWAEVE